MSDETLKPCPFCGGEAHIVNDYSSERDETRWNLWHECNGHEGESNGYGYSLHPWFETPWYKTEAEAIAAWNTRATHGTLTAEQVRECVQVVYFEGYSDGSVNRGQHLEETNWQAIADELNARAERTCEPTEEYYCKCGQDLILCDMGIGPNGGAIELDPPILFNYCPNCGAKVRNE